jgi:hypothetical protein
VPTGVGKTLDSGKLAELWPLLVMPLLNLALAGMAAVAMCWMFQTERELTPALIVSGTWGNSAALPLVLLNALCKQPILADVDDCDDRSMAYIMVYTIPWSVCFFLLAMPVLKNVSDAQQRRMPTLPMEVADGLHDGEPAQTARDGSSDSFALLHLRCDAAAWRAALLNGPMAGTVLGVGCACWPWLKDHLFAHNSVLRPVGLTIASCASPAVNLFTLVMAASLVPPSFTDRASGAAAVQPVQKPQPLLHTADDTSSNAPKSNDNSLQQLDRRSAGMHEDEQRPVTGEVAADTTDTAVENVATSRPAAAKFDLKLGLALSTLRLLLVPAAGVGVQYAVAKLGWMPFDKLGLLICYLEMVVSAPVSLAC